MAVDGCRGARLTGETTEAAAEAVERLLPVGDVSHRRAAEYS